MQGGSVWSAGRTPNAQQVAELAGGSGSGRPKPTSASTPAHCRPGTSRRTRSRTHCGLLVVPISRSRRDLLLVPARADRDGELGRLPLRKARRNRPARPAFDAARSFELWQESVQGTAKPWKEVEVEAAAARGRGARRRDRSRRAVGPHQPRAGNDGRRARRLRLRRQPRPQGAAAGHPQLRRIPHRGLRGQARRGGGIQAAGDDAAGPAHGFADRVAAALLADGPRRDRRPG